MATFCIWIYFGTPFDFFSLDSGRSFIINKLLYDFFIFFFVLTGDYYIYLTEVPLVFFCLALLVFIIDGFIFDFSGDKEAEPRYLSDTIPNLPFEYVLDNFDLDF